MFTKRQRIALARIVSDMIKADNIIDESEIEMLNRFKVDYNLDQEVLKEAHRMKFSEAVSEMKEIPDNKKMEVFNIIRKVALVDGICVPREAMLLLAMQYSLGIDLDQNRIIREEGINLISCPTGENTINSQYVIYIEGQFNQQINDDIEREFKLNVLKLRQWGFDFIYIPSLIKEFSQMKPQYVKDVVRYMVPDLPTDTIDTVYDRLLQMDTVKFCNYVLAEKLHVASLKNTEPSLLINIGTSIVPYCSVSGPIECYTEFLCVPVKNVTELIDKFIKNYEKLVSSYTVGSPIKPLETRNFRYFGFYKALFDFLVKAQPKESEIVVYPWNYLLTFPHISTEIRLSPQESTIYKLILYYSLNHPLGGLPSSYSRRYQHEIEDMYRKMYHRQRAEYPDNLAPIRSRIESKLRQELGNLSNIDDYIPKMKDGKYIIAANPDNVFIKEDRNSESSLFVDYNW
jgi:hypothetical protein